MSFEFSKMCINHFTSNWNY